MRRNIVLSATLLICSLQLFPVTYVIDQPGTYKLGQDIVDPGVDLIQITVGNVVLDLEEHTVAAGMNGIVIDPGLSTITIRNGIITNLQQDGVVIGANCLNVRLSNLTIAQCGGNGVRGNSGLSGVFLEDLFVSGITNSAIAFAANTSSIQIKEGNIGNCGGNAVELLGTSTADLVRDVLVDSLSSSSCCLSPTFSHVIRVTYGRNVIFRNTTIANSGNLANQIKLIELEHSKICAAQFATCSGNFGNSLVGLSLIDTHSSIFRGTAFLNSTAQFGDFVGFLLTDSSSNNFLGQCAVATSSAAGDLVAFDIQSGTKETSISEARVAGVVGTNVIAFNIRSQGDVTHFNLINDSQFVQSLALTGTIRGCVIDNADNGGIRQSIFSFNSAPNGRAIGLHFSGSGGNQWNVNNCSFTQNVGQADSDSFGILIDSGSENLFLQNFAFRNGGSFVNQMCGVPLGSISALTPENLNSASTPWANVVVTTI